MKDRCPYCASKMIETDEAFFLESPNGTIEVTGVHHNKCPECGEMTFRPEHLDETEGLQGPPPFRVRLERGRLPRPGRETRELERLPGRYARQPLEIEIKPKERKKQ